MLRSATGDIDSTPLLPLFALCICLTTRALRALPQTVINLLRREPRSMCNFII